MTKMDRKSDNSVVPVKGPNKGITKERPAEAVEGRELAKRKQMRHNTGQTQSWETVQSKLQLLHRKAKEDKQQRFSSLMHHVWNPVTLKQAYFSIESSAAAGVDGKTYKMYGEQLEQNLTDLSDRLKQRSYRAKPVRRVYIPKGNNQKRPLGIPVLEDRIVQKAVTIVLNAIYEADFLGFSYGFRSKRSQHQALDALYAGLMVRKVRWVLDSDIQNFFGTVNHEWMIKFIKHRIADTRVIRLIQKWLNAGVLEAGIITYAEEGTPQGGNISPLMANIYLHYVFDLWTQNWRQTKAQSEVIVVRYADDTVLGFQFQTDAEQYSHALNQRLNKFGLKLNEEKTRLIEFGRYATTNRSNRNAGKPETFTFLGFTHMCGTTRNGKFTIIRHTIKSRMRSKVQIIKEALRIRMHQKTVVTGKWLRTVLLGHYRYFGVSGNMQSMEQFRFQLLRHWLHMLRRRSQQRKFTWKQMDYLALKWLPCPKIYHLHPLERIGVIT